MGKKRCDKSHYNKVALCNVCDINCTKCNGYKKDCIDNLSHIHH